MVVIVVAAKLGSEGSPPEGLQTVSFKVVGPCEQEKVALQLQGTCDIARDQPFYVCDEEGVRLDCCDLLWRLAALASCSSQEPEAAALAATNLAEMVHVQRPLPGAGSSTYKVTLQVIKVGTRIAMQETCTVLGPGDLWNPRACHAGGWARQLCSHALRHSHPT